MRRVCVFTGTRAEYGLLRNLMHELDRASNIELKIIATGSHLTESHGYTLSEIQKDGFVVDEEVELLLASDTPRSIGTSIGLGTIGITNALFRLKPDILVVLGDRYEALAAAQSAMVLGIPIAHIHGGEATEGLIDEAIRHAITKMSHIHFVTAEPYKRRVLQLGEQPVNVHKVGAPALDNIANLDVISKLELENFIGIKLGSPLFLVTYHPLTLDANNGSSVDNLTQALDHFPNASIVFTGANADADGSKIARDLQAYCKQRYGRSRYAPSLGFRRYLSLMMISDVVIGNSSSGIIEAPTIGVPTVNIGSRQRGRLKAPSVIDSGEESIKIKENISKALTPSFRQLSAKRISPFGKPGVAKKICNVLQITQIDDILMKKFFDQ